MIFRKVSCSMLFACALLLGSSTKLFSSTQRQCRLHSGGRALLPTILVDVGGAPQSGVVPVATADGTDPQPPVPKAFPLTQATPVVTADGTDPQPPVPPVTTADGTDPQPPVPKAFPLTQATPVVTADGTDPQPPVPTRAVAV
jgi:hypothetical protein